jgi:hypothetical protein
MRLKNRPSVVCGAIINHDELPAGKSLRAHALYRLHHIFGMVIGGQDDGNKRVWVCSLKVTGCHEFKQLKIILGEKWFTNLSIQCWGQEMLIERPCKKWLSSIDISGNPARHCLFVSSTLRNSLR